MSTPATTDFLHRHRFEIPGRGTFWGHDGSVWGGGAITLTSADRSRQACVALNLQRWNTLAPSGHPQPHAIDAAFAALLRSLTGARPELPPL
ncbi:hypothetical protein AB0H20_17340 [Nocardia fluminea]|uniref:hypothetical protein n=1 Tax=Nocardia fluminea TaxID=134984 RepID=UPI0034006F37